MDKIKTKDKPWENVQNAEYAGNVPYTKNSNSTQTEMGRGGELTDAGKRTNLNETAEKQKIYIKSKKDIPASNFTRAVLTDMGDNITKPLRSEKGSRSVGENIKNDEIFSSDFKSEEKIINESLPNVGAPEKSKIETGVESVAAPRVVVGETPAEPPSMEPDGILPEEKRDADGQTIPVGASVPATGNLTERESAACETILSPPSPKISPSKYAVHLICVFLALCSLAVYSVGAAEFIAKSEISIPTFLLRGVFSAGLTTLPKVEGAPSLPQIPNANVEPDDDSPAAAEEETVGVEEPPAPEEDSELPIRSVDVSCAEKNGFGIINETPYEPDLAALAKEDSKIPPISEIYEKFGDDAPVVLILHTHGSESYSPDGAESYSSKTSFRSVNPEETVVSVGRAMSKVLNSKGINAAHCATMFDVEDYNSAYSKAAAEINRYLKEYPSINYVFDVHRDALITSDGENLRPISDVGGKDAAQVMLVVGTDAGGSGHTEWRDNLSFAAKIQSKAHGAYPSFMRSINLRSPSFNEQYAKGSLLIEVGAAANSLNEAALAGETLAGVIADIIGGK